MFGIELCIMNIIVDYNYFFKFCGYIWVNYLMKYYFKIMKYNI